MSKGASDRLPVMDPDSVNKQYWSTVEPDKILSGHYLPGDELFSLLPPHSKILDVGCGPGKLSEYLYQKDFNVVGIDINAQALERNRKRNSHITYIEADVTQQLPFEDASFDCAVMAYVLVSVISTENEKQLASELTRILKPHGVLWIAEATHSKEYEERYKLGKDTLGIDNVALSFSKNPATERKIERVIRHYSQQELDVLFAPLQTVSCKEVAVTSQSSGMTLQTLVSVYRKP